MDGDNGHATAFLNRFPCVNKLEWVLSEVHPRLNLSILFPVCLNNTSVGVLELTGNYNLGYLGKHVMDNLKEAGLYEFSLQDHIPYKTVNGLKLAMEEIDEALQVVCQSHKLSLAQVWIAHEDEKKRLFALKLTGRLHRPPSLGHYYFYVLCHGIPLANGDVLALKTLQDYESRYIPNLHSDMLIGWDGKFFRENRGLTLCLRSSKTGDLDYAFEFIWTKVSDVSLEAILLTLKKCLPGFKFSSGVELGDELDVKTIMHNEVGENQNFKIFQEKRSSLMMNEDAENLDGSESAFSLEVGYDKYIFKLHLPISQATFATLEKEIGMHLKLSVGTYKLEYLDDDEDWILLTCDEEMGDCLSLTPELFLRVTPWSSPQPI